MPGKTNDTIEKRFAAWQEFHRDNPEIFKLFNQFGDQAREAGRKRISGRLILERIRWYTAVETTTAADDFKINDHHYPFYVRLMIGLDSRFSEMFELRTFGVSIEDIVRAHKRIHNDKA